MKKPKKFRVGRSNTGLGLFATETIPKHELIVEYTGRLISNAKARELESTRANRYLFELNSRWTIDGSSRRNLARYCNHSCEPNCIIEIWSSGGCLKVDYCYYCCYYCYCYCY